MSILWRTWAGLGQLTYWLTWPALWLYLNGSQRTRLLLVCGDEVLVLRGWPGDGRWGLPGGGLHRREVPVDGLLREVREETGLQLSAGQLKSVGQAAARENKISFSYHGFVCRLRPQDKPELKLQRPEIVEAAWRSLKEVDQQPAAYGTIVLEMLRRWRGTP